MDRETWQATAQGVTKSQTQLSMHICASLASCLLVKDKG